MSFMSDPISALVAGLELILIFAGLVFLWRLGVSPTARTRVVAVRLPAWDVPITDFLLFLLLVLCGSMVAAIAAGVAVKRLPLSGDAVTVFNGAAAQLGMLGGVAAHRFGIRRPSGDPVGPSTGILTSGAVTFLVSLPLLTATSLAWQAFLQLCGLPAERQDLIGMFVHADSPLLLGIMITLAIAIAPVAEEMVFRAGLYRYFRTRMPRWIALVVPSLIFATLHVNWKTLDGFASLAPLTVLAVIFSLAYERTGRIGTAIVAHGLFNLNTILLILSGVGV
jgi:membrane protease YdiL (CAAX protease family)